MCLGEECVFGGDGDAREVASLAGGGPSGGGLAFRKGAGLQKGGLFFQISLNPTLKPGRDESRGRTHTLKHTHSAQEIPPVL